jgi:hypothetical protein
MDKTTKSISHMCHEPYTLLCETNHILLRLVTKPNVIFYPLKQLSTFDTFAITFIFQIKMNIKLEKNDIKFNTSNDNQKRSLFMG